MEHRLCRRLAAAMLLAAVLVASGCTEDRVRPSDTLPPTSTTSATPTEPEDAPGATGYPLPEEARAYTPEGARAYFDYFIAVLNASHLASDPAPLREITQGCEFCDELSQRFEETGASGRRVVGGDLVLTSVGEVSIRPLESGAKGAGMAFIAIQQASQSFDSTGNLFSDSLELELVGSVELAWLVEERDWLVNLFGVDTRE